VSVVVPIIDVDSHVTEPPDLWTSRVPRSLVDRVPHVVWDERRGEERWQIGDRRLFGVAGTAMAGWKEFPPSHPKTLDQADPGSWQAPARVQRLDEYGIAQQVLYPNLIGFFMSDFLKLGKAEALVCVQAYNDFVAQFAVEGAGRFIPLMVVPFWDLEAAIAEMDRCVARGHRGIVFARKLYELGLPTLGDQHWDPLWAAASERSLSINFHVGFDGDDGDGDAAGSAMKTHGVKQDYVIASLMSVSANMRTIAEVIVRGICHRFPDLKIVSVESGVGWLPFLVEALDWHWCNTGAGNEFPDMELPSFYFDRQVYGTMWFEKDSLKRSIDRFADNIMYSTDYPHPTSMSPGPASCAELPKDFVDQLAADLPESIMTRLLYENAARVYNLAPVAARS
jgi:uncharacterized protein